MKDFLKKIWAWMRTDGLLHLTCSFVIFVFLCLVMPVWVATLITLWVGVWKEFYDRSNGGVAEWHDILCDAIGVVLGIIFIVLEVWIGRLF